MREKRVQGRYARTGEGSMITAPEFEPIENVYPSLNGSKPAQKGKQNNRRWSVADLYDAEFPDLKCIVPGIFYEGLNILAARPKKGKSWMGLQLAGAVGNPGGGMFMGQRVEFGRVLYLALEDGPRRIKSRLQKQHTPRDADITFLYEWPAFHRNGTTELLAEIERENYRLVIIDTLTRAFPGLDPTRDAAKIGACLGRLQKVAVNSGCCILCIDHTRKPNGMEGDPVDDAMGRTDKHSSADLMATISPQRGKAGVSFQGSGREVPPFDLTIRFDGLTCTWQLIGNTTEVETSRNKQQILDVLTAGGRMQSSQIVKECGRDKGNVYHDLGDLWTAGKIRKDEQNGKVYYELAPTH